MAPLFYSATTSTTLVAAASTSPFFCITGSASKTVKIRRIHMDGFTLTDPELLTLLCRKLSAPPTGGTSTDLTKVAYDSAQTASTVNSCKTYTAAPSAGTLVGNVCADRILGEDTTPVSGATQVEILKDFSQNGIGGIVLNGISEAFALAFAVAPASAVSLVITVEWSEE